MACIIQEVRLDDLSFGALKSLFLHAHLLSLIEPT